MLFSLFRRFAVVCCFASFAGIVSGQEPCSECSRQSEANANFAACAANGHQAPTVRCAPVASSPEYAPESTRIAPDSQVFAVEAPIAAAENSQRRRCLRLFPRLRSRPRLFGRCR
jgi:hypothetical protein